MEIGSIWRNPSRRTVASTPSALPSSSCDRIAIRRACARLSSLDFTEFALSQLPEPPGRLLEVGCGYEGGATPGSGGRGLRRGRHRPQSSRGALLPARDARRVRRPRALRRGCRGPRAAPCRSTRAGARQAGGACAAPDPRRVRVEPHGRRHDRLVRVAAPGPRRGRASAEGAAGLDRVARSTTRTSIPTRRCAPRSMRVTTNVISSGDLTSTFGSKARRPSPWRPASSPRAPSARSDSATRG